MGRVGASRRGILILPVLVGVALVGGMVAGCSAPTPRPAAASSTPEPEPTPKPVVPDIPIADAGVGNVTVVGSVAPVRIALPDLGIDMSVEAEGVDDDGQMGLPENAAVAGWYRYGPGLRDAAGATVVAAHIDSRHDGIGPFSLLKNAAVGSTVSMTGSDGSTAAYVVREVRSVGKIEAPMAELFDRAGAPRLVLVTCGGAFDSSTGHYVDNVVVTADPVSSTPAGG
ncbi:MAG: hypothetical protein RI885_2061 [Actinomycetota bacterium]|jgi:hypothetical protein